MAERASAGTRHTDWFVHDRFGMFVHWGTFTLAACRAPCWLKYRGRIPDEEYRRYFDHLDPDLYDPAVWAQEARNAGMKYFVVTTKQHEGFPLWDSAETDYKATNTPYGKDLLRPMVDAFRDEGLRVGFYHSLLDWHHPEFPIDGIHPMCDNVAFREAQKGRDIRKYAGYLHAQTRELLTQFGKVDILWFDFSYAEADWGWSKGKGKDDWQSEKLLAMVRELQPGIVVNDRLDIPGDFVTPEQYQPHEAMRVDGRPVLWEACQCFTGSWGYDRDNMDWKRSDLLVRMLVDAVSKDGNMLLNVGPTGRGELEGKAIERLRDIGEWMRRHSRAIYGCGRSELVPPPDGRYTQNGNRLYLHLFAWPFRHVYLAGLAGRVEYAQLLNDASEIRTLETDPHSSGTSSEGQRGGLTLQLPVQKPDVLVPVVELFLKP